MNTFDVRCKSGLKKYKSGKKLYQVFVSHDRDYSGEPYYYSYLFNSLEEAEDRKKFIEENWKNPTIDYCDDVYINHLDVLIPQK